MRVSEYYKIGKSQSSLPFLDVDIYTDTKLFINSNAIANLKSDFGIHCNELIRDFFSEFLKAVKSGNNQRALMLLANLKEPNETHLGLSTDESDGRGLGEAKAREMLLAFRESYAVKTGLLKDLEDSVLLIEGISVDILSDIITNIIRGPLITYTQQMCELYEIEMEEEVSSGPVWNILTKNWEVDYVKLPVPNGTKLILVPKSIVRIVGAYNVGEYYRHYVLERLREEELGKDSSLVKLIKSGKNKGRHVYKNDLQAKYGSAAKTVAIQQTQKHPDLLLEYKNKKSNPTPALTHSQIAEALNIAPPNWDDLLRNVVILEPGKKNAYKYEGAILDLLTSLFHPALVDPEVQTPIEDGLKRVDITFTNYARTGFFEWLSRNFHSPYVIVECKNYGAELGNPEIDQIAMRFKEGRGKFGILICRNIEKREKLLERCRLIAKERKEYIIVLDDSDLSELVNEVRATFPQDYEFNLLKAKFKDLVF